MGLAGKTVVVTGGATGIGAAYARAFAAETCNVVVADVQEQAGEALVASLQGDGGRAVFVRTDVSDEQSTANMAKRARDKFGTVDVIVNNAAMYQNIGEKRPFENIPVEEWDRVMAVNVRGVWLCMKAVTPQMRERGGGKIINISSGTVHAGVPWFCHYTASKAAVIGLTRAAARELGPAQINVNCIAPGLVDNEASASLNTREYLDNAPTMRAIKRPMRSEDLIGTALYLASPASDFVTGQTFIVDGGVTMQ